MTPTNYRGWRVIFSPVHFSLDTAALQRESYRLALLVHNQLTEFSHTTYWPNSAIQRLSSVYHKSSPNRQANGSAVSATSLPQYWQRSIN